MNYSEALNFITCKESLGIKPGLVRIKSALQKLGNPQDKVKIIHIAGTNGKGTVAATISKALVNNGLKTGLFTTPWVVDYRDQIQLNGEYITQYDFVNTVREIKDAVADCTEFETLTVAAYFFFASKNVDYAVIECGMGGLGDATNVEKSNIAVITSISLDHTDYFGNTIEKIAEEKSGILRQDCTCVLYNRELSELFESKCAKLVTCKEKCTNLKLVNLVLKELGINPVKRLVRLPARQEIVGEVLLDGGHNVSAAKNLVKYLEGEVAVIGMLKDKDVEGYLSLIAPKCKTIVAVTVNSPRALEAEYIADIADEYCDEVYIVSSPKEAIRVKNLSLVCGSFYLAREIRKLLTDNI